MRVAAGQAEGVTDAGSATPLQPWPARADIAFTIGTLVTRLDEYAAMRRSFVAGGFGEGDCEYLAIDNTKTNQVSAYAGLNRVLGAARGRHVILCHQDVRLLTDGRANLEARLDELERRDPAWGVAGNAGGVGPGDLAIRITDPHGTDTTRGTLPARVTSLDENFLVVKQAAGLRFSRDLDGFHLYGADICMVAAMLGYNTWVIDFHLRHLSAGSTKTAAFEQSQQAFERKWSRALGSRFVQTTCVMLVLSGTAAGRTWRRLAARPLVKIKRWKQRRTRQ